MRGFNSESFDLIAIDPPFNTGLDWHAKKGAKITGSYQDRWSWDDGHDRWLESLYEDGWNSLAAVVEAARDASGKPMGAFICWLAVRLVRMHRILKPTGSIFVHLDHHAVHYAKAALDAIFGCKNFRNEIIWHYSKGSSPKKDLRRKHDSILRYTKSDDYEFIPPRYEHLESQLKRFNQVDEDGRTYRINHTKDKEGNYKRFYLDEGVQADDVWSYLRDGTFDQLPHNAEENTDYPTQKPLSVYRRIVTAATKPGDWVLDCFCGCATTCIAAEIPDPDKPGLGCRNWIGIDIWAEAADVIRDRVQKECNHLSGGEVIVTKDIPERSDGGEEAEIKDPPSVERVPPAKDGMSYAERKALLIKQAGGAICAGCERDDLGAEYLEVDHNTPKSQKGLDHISNRLLLCSVCNRLKSNRLTLAGLHVRIRKIAKDPSHELHKWAIKSPLVTKGKR